MGDILLRRHGEIIYPVDGSKCRNKCHSLHIDDGLYADLSQLDAHLLQGACNSIVECPKQDRTVEDSPLLSQTEKRDLFLNIDQAAVIQEAVRRLRGAGALSNPSCAVHIHINAAPFSAPKLRNLVHIVAAKEDMIYRALQVDWRRAAHYCKKMDRRFLEELDRQRPESLEEFKRIWYGGEDHSRKHYDPSRYHCLNLHSVFQKGTIEFRAFNGSLHAGKIKAYIQFCLAVTAQAYNQRYARPEPTVSENEKYTFRTWLLRMGLIGEEFKTARLHLLRHLEGDIAWKDPAQAQRQKERQQRRRALEAQWDRLEAGRAPPEPEEQAHHQNAPEEPSSSGFTMSM